MKAIRTYTFKVVCGMQGPFPIDMLRYDGCNPRSSTDMAIIEDQEICPQGTIVELYKVTQRDDWKPTEDRWASFSWLVVAGSVQMKEPDTFDITKEEIRRIIGTYATRIKGEPGPEDDPKLPVHGHYSCKVCDFIAGGPHSAFKMARHIATEHVDKMIAPEESK